MVGLVLFALIPLGLLASLRRWWRLASLQAPSQRLRFDCGRGHLPGPVAGGLDVAHPGSHCAGPALSGGRGGAARSLGVRGGRGGEDVATPHSNDALNGSKASAISRRRWWLVGRGAAGVVLLGAVALVLSLYLSDVYVRRAEDEKGHSETAQLADARTASTLDPWAVDPHYLEASALETTGNRPAARAQLEQARRLEPESLVPLGLLGDFEARGGHFLVARRYYREALAHDPLDTGLQQLALTGGRPSSS